MIACILIPGFELRAALRDRPRLGLKPAALAPLPGTEPVLGPVTAAAEAAGVRPGMRLGEALATCPSLVLVERDPAGVEQAVGGDRSAGSRTTASRSSPSSPGCLYFETRGVERLYGGVAAALQAGARGRRHRLGRLRRRRRPPLRRARRGGDRPPGPGARRLRRAAPKEFLAPLPLTLLPLEQERREELEQLGVKKIGQLAGLPGAAVAERLGPDGRRAWSLARGEDTTIGCSARRPPAEIAERLEFPEAVGNELTLRRALDGTARPDPRAPRARRAGDPQGRALGAARRRRLVASHA